MTPGDLVSLDMASLWLKRDQTDDDMMVEMIITSASAAVMDYLQDGIYAFTDSAGELMYDSAGDLIYDSKGILRIVQAACLFLIAHMYANPTGETKDLVNPQFGYGYLPQGIMSVLFPYRVLTVA